MHNCTCHTEGCPNAGHPIPMNLTYIDDDTGEEMTVDSVSCGPCGQPITDIVPMDEAVATPTTKEQP